MPALLAWLLSAFGSLVGYSALRFTATKLFLWTMAITVFPLLMSRVIYMFIQTMMTTVDSVYNTYGVEGEPFVMTLTGVAAWFAIHLKLVEGFTLIMSSVLFRMAIRMIPFVRL